MLERGGPTLRWHIERSQETGQRWAEPVDLVFVDGDHELESCRLDWELFSRWVTPGGVVVFHDARQDKPGGEGLPGNGGVPGPTTLVDELFRGPDALDGWRIRTELHTIGRRRTGQLSAALMSRTRCSTGTPRQCTIRGRSAAVEVDAVPLERQELGPAR